MLAADVREFFEKNDPEISALRDLFPGHCGIAALQPLAIHPSGSLRIEPADGDQIPQPVPHM